MLIERWRISVAHRSEMSTILELVRFMRAWFGYIISLIYVSLGPRRSGAKLSLVKIYISTDVRLL